MKVGRLEDNAYSEDISSQLWDLILSWIFGGELLDYGFR